MTQDNRILKEAQGSTQDNWQDCPTMKSVVEAMERGDEIEYRCVGGEWVRWSGTNWSNGLLFQCRPAKKTKTVVIRESLWRQANGSYAYSWSSKDVSGCVGFIRYTGNERTEEVPE